MVARAAEINCSVFRKEGPLETYDVIKEYLKVAVDFDNQANNTKYAVQNMLGSLQHETPEGVASIKSQTLEELW
jgi:tRNA-dihydrouridine synthase 2